MTRKLATMFPAAAGRAARLSLVAATACLPACGGSEDPIIRSTTFLPVYRYEMRQDADSATPLELAAVWNGDAYRIAIRFSGSGGLTGLYDHGNGVSTIAPASELTAETSLATPLIGAFRAAVLAEIALTPAAVFSAGTWTVFVGNDSVRVVVVTGANAGVDLALNGGATAFFAWPEFAQLFAPGSTAPAWQQAASASFRFLRIAALQARVAFTALVDATRVSFTDAPDVQRCDAFPGAPPAGVLGQGERVLTWLGSANLGFDLQFTDCWDDLAGEDQDYLYQGAVALTGWRASNDLDNRLVFIGFGGDENGERVPGGVAYRDTRLVQTLATMSGDSELDPAADYVLRGGFAIRFVQP